MNTRQWPELRQKIETLEEELRAMRAELDAIRRRRNEAIAAARRSGKTLGQLARIYGISREGVRYVASCQPSHDS